MKSSQRIKDEEQLSKWKEELAKAAEQADESQDMELGSGASGQWTARFSTSEAQGRALYNSFTDEELLELLRSRTRKLGHVPAQKEMFWAYRNYLRMRFDKWPYGLKKAGLSAQAGKGGMTVEQMEERGKRHEELMETIRAKAAELGRPPHMFEMEGILKELRGRFTTWAQVLDAAGVDRSGHKKERLYKIKRLKPEEEELLAELRKMAAHLGRVPLRSEVPDEMRKRLNKCCGTWRNTLYQIGLEPVTKVSPFENTYLNRGKEQQRKQKDVLENSLYKLVDPDEETKVMLQQLSDLARRLGRAPVKREVEPRVYSILTKKCSTFRNVLYQLGLEPLSKGEAGRIEAGLKKSGEKTGKKK